MNDEEMPLGRIRNYIRGSLQLLVDPGDFPQGSMINWWFDWVYADTDQEQDFEPEVWAALMSVDRRLRAVCDEKGDVPYTDPRWTAIRSAVEQAIEMLGPMEEGVD